MKWHLLIFGLAIGLFGLARPVRAETYSEHWTATKWRAAYFVVEDHTLVNSLKVLKQALINDGYSNVTILPRRTASQVVLADQGLKDTSPAFCLGPSEWSVTSTVAGMPMTETWKGGVWRDAGRTTTQAVGNYPIKGFSVIYGETATCPPETATGLTVGPVFSYALRFVCSGQPAGVYDPVYQLLYVCGGHSPTDTVQVIFSLDLGENPDGGGGLGTHYFPGTGESITPYPVQVYPAAMYGGFYSYRSLGGIVDGNRWNNIIFRTSQSLFLGGVSSYPVTWTVNGVPGV